ncbi:DUF502 domain-containing protein [Litoribacillus peritrichatus]|uniref:DUF502 domain-containing protein n=1 Tax=Litoribacillus peritrichatus TaxID=718191 RepID=A0ABP7MCG5_9GAMM
MNHVTKEDFFKKSALGGLIILLPIAILWMGFNWLFRLVTDLIQPLTNLVVNFIGLPEFIGDLLVLSVMVLFCFAVGYFVSTQLGTYLHHKFDDRLAKLAPGYRMVKEIVDQFFGDQSKSPFANGEVALVRPFGDAVKTEVTAIVTSKHPDGRYTVFVPTGPNPTSGNMFHLDASQVTLYPDAKVEDMMRTIIACGAGSGALFQAKPVEPAQLEEGSEKPES